MTASSAPDRGSQIRAVSSLLPVASSNRPSLVMPQPVHRTRRMVAVSRAEDDRYRCRRSSPHLSPLRQRAANGRGLPPRQELDASFRRGQRGRPGTAARFPDGDRIVAAHRHQGVAGRVRPADHVYRGRRRHPDRTGQPTSERPILPAGCSYSRTATGTARPSQAPARPRVDPTLTHGIQEVSGLPVPDPYDAASASGRDQGPGLNAGRRHRDRAAVQLVEVDRTRGSSARTSRPRALGCANLAGSGELRLRSRARAPGHGGHSKAAPGSLPPVTLRTGSGSTTTRSIGGGGPAPGLAGWPAAAQEGAGRTRTVAACARAHAPSVLTGIPPTTG